MGLPREHCHAVANSERRDRFFYGHQRRIDIMGELMRLVSLRQRLIQVDRQEVQPARTAEGTEQRKRCSADMNDRGDFALLQCFQPVDLLLMFDLWLLC